MQLDPSRFLVSLAGFAYDWIITREWKKVVLTMLPLVAAISMVGIVFWGSRRDSRALAQWYMELGNEEIAEWENSWAPEDSKIGIEDSEPGNEEISLLNEENSDSETDDGEKVEVSRFAEVIFRRVQLLAPSDRSQYVIGATLAQRGAHAQAEQILTKIAPESGSSGYAPAHAILAHMLMPRIRSDQAKYMPLVLHHLKEAARWARVPIETLAIASRLYELTEGEGRKPQAIAFATIAAERDPIQNIALARLARETGNVKLAERATKTAKEHLIKMLEDDATNIVYRVNLAQIYAGEREMDEAQQLLFEKVDGLERTPALARAQSNFFLMKFQQGTSASGSKASVPVGLLDQAIRLDPDNEKIPETVASLARGGFGSASEESIAMLRKFLAEGKATTTTHMLLAETYLIREDFKKALPHLEQIVLRVPNAHMHLNNLAFVVAELHPERMKDAEQYAQRAVQAAAKQGAPNADYLDTLAMVLEKLDKNSEAIATIEAAIEINKQSADYHQRAAALYLKVGNEEMAAVHAEVAAAMVESNSPAETGAGG